MQSLLKVEEKELELQRAINQYLDDVFNAAHAMLTDRVFHAEGMDAMRNYIDWANGVKDISYRYVDKTDEEIVVYVANTVYQGM